MKRITLLASLLLLAAAAGCSTATNTNNANANATPAANTNANTTTIATPKTEANDAAASPIASQEKQIWDMIKTKNWDGFAGMLADDFMYVSSDGVYDKAGTVKGVKDLDLTDLSFSDWRVIKLDDDASVVTYTVNMKGTSGGQPIKDSAQRAGSLWVNRGGKWVGVFHQDTAITEPPPEEAAEKPAAKPPVATSESKAAEAASEDPIAREKQVWDAIKKRDYDRFASFLADEQVEVFAWGVNNSRSESVEGVKNVDLSSAMLSDFKTVKIDDDAVVVTYVVKGSKPLTATGSRASTAWVERDGKWLAVYHQDTDIQPATKK